VSGEPVATPRPSVTGPTGDVLTLADLPPSKQGRWVPRRKAEICLAVAGELLSIERVCQMYDLTPAELLSWMRAYSSEGLAGHVRTLATRHRDRDALP